MLFLTIDLYTNRLLELNGFSLPIETPQRLGRFCVVITSVPFDHESGSTVHPTYGILFSSFFETVKELRTVTLKESLQ